MSATPEQLGDAAWRFLDGEGDTDADRALLDALREDDALMDALAALSLTRQSLSETIGTKGSVAAFLEDSQDTPMAIVEPTAAPRRGFPRWAMAACVALGGLLIGALAFVFAPAEPVEPEPVGRPVAVLMRSENVQWQRDAIHEGDDVTTGPIGIAGGRVQMRLHSGVSISLRGPAHLNMHNPMRGRLDEGRVLARVPEGAEGFRIDTPDLSIVDLGTEFGVDVDANGASVVHVFAGRVRIERGEQTMEIAAGQSASLVEGELAVGEIDFARFPEATLPGGRLIDLAFGAEDATRLRGTADAIRDGSLEHAHVKGRGGHLVLDGSTGSQTAFVDIDTGADGAIDTAQLRTIDGHVGRDGGRVYLAWLMRGSFDATGWAGVSLFRGGDADLRDEPIFIGKANGHAAMSYYTAATGEAIIDALPRTPSLDTSAPRDRAVLVVVRLEFASETDRVSIWLDPDLHAEEPPDAANATLELEHGEFDRLRLGAGSGTGSWAFDELRMSGNWSDLAGTASEANLDSDVENGEGAEND